MESIAPGLVAADTGATDTGGLSKRLSELQHLNSRDLRTEWRRLFRDNPPNLSRDLLVRAVAYRVQELAHGGLPKATARKLATLVAEFGRDGQISVDATPQMKPGARLVREWRGRTHVVTLTDDGFIYAGESYPSLTSIAQKITGAHWSGPRFFGVAKRTTDTADTAPRRRSEPKSRHPAVEVCHGQA